MMERVSVKPELLQWAMARSGKGPDTFVSKWPKIEQWLTGESSPTLKQLESFAAATHTPIGFLFLPNPPVENVPIPDFRTMAAEHIEEPSPDMLDTIYTCQQRQEWYRDFERSSGGEALPFVGSAKKGDSIQIIADSIREALCFDIEERRQMRTWSEALRCFVEQVDRLGILVMVSGIVGNNTHRKLDPQEFRGFALVDSLAPLIFINGADTKSAQMFTLAHELAHVWLGQSALSDAQALEVSNHAIERKCNQVAAEVLVPLTVMQKEYDRNNDFNEERDRLARYFKVSTLVILRRMHDAGGLTRDEFWEEYARELKRLMAMSKGSGGDFYRTQPVRVGRRFARALYVSTLEGQTSFTEAFRMLGLKKMSTFRELGYRLGVGF